MCSATGAEDEAGASGLKLRAAVDSSLARDRGGGAPDYPLWSRLPRASNRPSATAIRPPRLNARRDKVAYYLRGGSGRSGQ